MPPKFLEHIVILCFERRYHKQNSVLRLNSNILPSRFLGWLRYCSTVIKIAYCRDGQLIWLEGHFEKVAFSG